MPDAIACSCGYRGPAVVIAGQTVCPICRTPAAPAAPGRPAAAPPAMPRPPSAAAAPAARSTTYRIPCPRGHVLKAGEHMLGQRVVCPECNEVFLLRKEDSLEERKKQKKARRAEEERMAKLWLSRAIWAAAFIVASLVGMIALSLAFRPPLPPRPAEPPSEPAPAAQTE
ncbi:MAG: hypothetical protein ACKOB1_08870 [Planctomycetia bacterium]